MITLGIDTSNYTTSAAIFDGSDYKLSRKILDVKEGMRGIRQSEGVFIHNKELPNMIDNVLDDRAITAVGASTTPRNIAGSYMPVFTVGQGYGKVTAKALDVPFYEFSHQDGHIMAGIHSADAYGLLQEPFISVHLSGGTTEILRTEYDGLRFRNEIVGGTLDISAGQLIDRVGVKMGLKFPCGKEMDEIAQNGSVNLKLPFSVKGTYFNLSGVETKLMQMIDGADVDVMKSVFVYVSTVLCRSISAALEDTGLSKILMVGGVASNSIIREGLTSEFGSDVFFATRELSSDNAVGTAVLAYMAEVNK